MFDLLSILLKANALSNTKPDFEKFVRAIKTNDPMPVTIGDIFADYATTANFFRTGFYDFVSSGDAPYNRLSLFDYPLAIKTLRNSVRFCVMNGWDYAFSFSTIGFPKTFTLVNRDTEQSQAQGNRAWQDDRGPITSWDEFEQYAWPGDLSEANVGAGFLAKFLPAGMKLMIIPGGVFETVTTLMGLVPFSYALYDQEDLVDATIKKVSGIIQRVVADVIDRPYVGGLFYGDDMGFASGTFVSPEIMRKKFLPEMKKIIDMAHNAGKLFVLHSCGNIYGIMEDLIEAGIDAKHSYEDKILPVEEAYRRYGSRIGIIGGVDMNLLAAGTEDAVRRRVRSILDSCASKGRYILGTGNSVASYIPLENYAALIDEAKRWNLERFGTEW